MFNEISETTFCLKLVKKQKILLIVFFMNYSKNVKKIAVCMRGSDFIFDYDDKALLLQ